YANSKRYFKAKEQEIAGMEQKIDTLQSQLKQQQSSSAQESGLAARGFTLKTNTDAREYFENQNMDVDSLARKIETKIISQNKAGEDNPLVPYAGMAGIMKINRIQILNNRWVLAEFTDGTYWGEAIISYFLDENNQLQFD